MITLELPADLRALRVVGPWLRAVLAYGDEDEDEVEALAGRLELALQEVCVNVVKHAYAGAPGGRVRIDYVPRGTSHTFVVRDDGERFDPATRPTVDLSAPTVGGYGLHVVESLCDELGYERRDDENRWTLTLHRAAQLRD